MLVWHDGGSVSCCMWPSWIAKGIESRAAGKEIGMKPLMAAGNSTRIDEGRGTDCACVLCLYYIFLNVHIYNVMIIVEPQREGAEREGGVQDHTGLYALDYCLRALGAVSPLLRVMPVEVGECASDGLLWSRFHNVELETRLTASMIAGISPLVRNDPRSCPALNTCCEWAANPREELLFCFRRQLLVFLKRLLAVLPSLVDTLT